MERRLGRAPRRAEQPLGPAAQEIHDPRAAPTAPGGPGRVCHARRPRARRPPPTPPPAESAAATAATRGICPGAGPGRARPTRCCATQSGTLTGRGWGRRAASGPAAGGAEAGPPRSRQHAARRGGGSARLPRTAPRQNAGHGAGRRVLGTPCWLATWSVELGTRMRRQAQSVTIGTAGPTCTIPGLERPPGLKGAGRAERASRDSRAAHGAGSPRLLGLGFESVPTKSFECCGLK